MRETELKPIQLYRKCQLDDLPFETTDDFEDISMAAHVVGQPRAEQALHFGVGIQRQGYNIFALGEQGTGRHTFIRDFISQRAEHEPVPEDICYVTNFDQKHVPGLLTIKAGQGKLLAKDMKHLIENIRHAMQTALENEEYQNRAQSITQEFQEKQKQGFEEIRKKAKEKNLVAMPTPSGLVFAPIKTDEEGTYTPEEYEKLPKEQKSKIDQNIEEMRNEAQRLVQNFPKWQREVREKEKAFMREVTEYTIDPLINELNEKYTTNDSVSHYLKAVRDDLVQNIMQLFPAQQSMPQQQMPGDAAAGMGEKPENPAERRYHINVLVDNSETKGAPVIYEENPTYQNLFGRVEHLAQMGWLITDFTMIRPGAIHRANSGYLILDALKLLTEPFAWEGLKRTLKTGKLKIESIGQMYSMISTVSLEPEALPIKIKVVLIGIPYIYYMLRAYDFDFGDLFKVSVDFARQMNNNRKNQHEFVRLLAGIVRQEKLLPFKRDAVGLVIERGSRTVGDAHKMSLHMESIINLLREADYWAQQNGNSSVDANDVQKAVDARIYRSDRLRESMQEQIDRDIVMIDTKGSSVGQINGLSVISLGDFAFSRPSRITARIRLGKGEVVDIEREVAMGGPIHSKGVLILSGFLGGRYALNSPLSLSASLVFEQSYGGVEGDSASSAELYALLSAIADVPIKQSFGVTGSVNQYGQIQPIGGVNEKIEGFFDVCKARGLTGDQGVLIPASNVQHLMLRKDVIDAVESGQFCIHEVKTIDEGIEILTGMVAGEPSDAGDYPPDSFNNKVHQRLKKFADTVKQFAQKDNDTKKEEVTSAKP
ncbi:Lon protease family protein [Desulfobacterium sp. N47]|uniref:endopeptidase La n=1 Tax=uncultured Desulfobacterium sp. TaxID=201089 RepID=E1YLQ5_9BACT|nr:hypothetical protein N47_E45500 [uncultured Desulfobacterium sp.]